MTLYETLTEAVNAMSAQGYTSPAQLQYWIDRIEAAARDSLPSSIDLQNKLNAALMALYDKLVQGGQVIRYHQDLPRFTLDKVRPQLRLELDKRIMASASLIKVNREQAIDKTVQRFSGWASSIPAGGLKGVDKIEEKTRIRKSLAQLPFEERRVIVDQSAKLVASINEVIAVDGGALAAIWHSHWRRPGYQFRHDHKELDEQVFPIRDNWAILQGLMTKAGRPYMGEMVRPGELPYCSCFYQFLYNLRSLPEIFRTKKGNEWLLAARERVGA